MSETLKKCPFDNSANVAVDYVLYATASGCKKKYHVVCNDCNAKIREDEYDTHEQAIEAWNKRADDKYNELVEFIKEHFISFNCDNEDSSLPCCSALRLLRKHGVDV